MNRLRTLLLLFPIHNARALPIKKNKKQKQTTEIDPVEIATLTTPIIAANANSILTGLITDVKQNSFAGRSFSRDDVFIIARRVSG